MIPLSRLFFLGIVFYLLYRFVFNFLVPVFRTTKQVRQQFRNMQDQANQGNPFQSSGQPFQSPGQPFGEQYMQPKQESSKSSRPGPSKEDYIEFEEVRGK